MIVGENVDVAAAHDFDAWMDVEFAEHRAAFDATVKITPPHLLRTLELIEKGVRAGAKLLLFGNGGSAADAQHIAAELVIRYKADRAPIAAIALTTDSSTLTACGNDLGFDAIFARQLEALGRPGDIAIGISTSGNSPNVVAAFRQAKRMGLHTVGLTAGSGGEMAGLCDVVLAVPSRVTARIQEMHILLGHMLCKALEQRLGLV
jgi:D-sedoheptulose 7-phosphate isomerase